MFKRLLILILIFWGGFWLYGKLKQDSNISVKEISDQLKKEISETDSSNSEKNSEAKTEESPSASTKLKTSETTETSEDSEKKSDTTPLSSDKPSNNIIAKDALVDGKNTEDAGDTLSLLEVKNPSSLNEIESDELGGTDEAVDGNTPETIENNSAVDAEEKSSDQKNLSQAEGFDGTETKSVQNYPSKTIQKTLKKEGEGIPTSIIETVENKDEPSTVVSDNQVQETPWPAARMTNEAPDARIKVYLYEWGIDISNKTLSARNIEFEVINSGRFAHNFSLKDDQGNILNVGGKVLPKTKRYFRIEFLPGSFEVFSDKNKNYTESMTDYFLIR